MNAPAKIIYANRLRDEFLIVELNDGRTLLVSLQQILSLRPKVIGTKEFFQNEREILESTDAEAVEVRGCEDATQGALRSRR